MDLDAIFHFDSWVNIALGKLETDGVTGGFHRHTRPRTRSEIAEIIRQAQIRVNNGSTQPARISLELLAKLAKEFKHELRSLSNDSYQTRLRTRTALQFRSRQSDTELAPALEGAFYYDINQALTLYQEFELSRFPYQDSLAGKTASKRLKPWKKDFAADFKRIYLSFPIHKFQILIGRNQLFWGTGFRGSVGISNNSPPFDLVLLSGKFGKIKGTAFTAQLDHMWHDQGPRRYLTSRYLAGHRLDYQMNDYIEFGISELILYGGESRSVEWQYFNPILPYYASQFNADRDDNVMFIFEGAIRPCNGFRLYAEQLIDDAQYVRADDPNAFAWLLGLEWNRVLQSRRLGIRSEYARVNRWAYTHLVQENQFTHFGAIIGHPIGTDADLAFLEGNYLLDVDTRVSVFFEHGRHGEGGVADRYRGEDFRAIPFPSGIIECRYSFGFKLVYEPLRGWQLDFGYQHSRTRNRNHEQGVNQNSNHLEFQFRYLWEQEL